MNLLKARGARRINEGSQSSGSGTSKWPVKLLAWFCPKVASLHMSPVKCGSGVFTFNSVCAH